MAGVTYRWLRRPRVKRRVQPAVLQEVQKSLQDLGRITNLKRDMEVSDWAHKPKFGYLTKVDERIWRITFYHDKNSEAGRIYNWVNYGTGSRGDDPQGKTYPIVPKRAKALRFNLPMKLKTFADSGEVAPSFNAPKMTVTTQLVKAPGIYPRHFSKELWELLQSRKSGSIHNEVEAAIKRAFRRLGIYVG